jgi:hypothetical protein
VRRRARRSGGDVEVNRRSGDADDDARGRRDGGAAAGTPPPLQVSDSRLPRATV